MKRTPMRRRSTKKASHDRERRKVCQEIYRQRGDNCEVVSPNCSGCVEEYHEKQRRSQGGSAIDPDNILGTCRLCHLFIHANPAESFERGWLVRGVGL